MLSCRSFYISNSILSFCWNLDIVSEEHTNWRAYAHDDRGTKERGLHWYGMRCSPKAFCLIQQFTHKHIIAYAKRYIYFMRPIRDDVAPKIWKQSIAIPWYLCLFVGPHTRCMYLFCPYLKLIINLRELCDIRCSDRYSFRQYTTLFMIKIFCENAHIRRETRYLCTRFFYFE